MQRQYTGVQTSYMFSEATGVQRLATGVQRLQVFRDYILISV